MSPARARRWLDDATLDSLPLLAVGTSAQLRGGEGFVVKVAHPRRECKARLRQELRLFDLLLAEGFPVPAVLARDSRRARFVRRWIEGPSLRDLAADSLTEDQLDQVFELLERTRRFERRHRVTLDVAPSNLVLERRFVLVDAGTRKAPNPMSLATRATLRERIVAHSEWCRQRERRQLVPMCFPPGGQLHVDVRVGPAPGARLLWRNDGAIERTQLRLDDNQLMAMANLATHAEATTTRPASRYQDDPRGGPKGARGDGRSIYLGVSGKGPERRELVLKGCGPTPLAWKGRKYHSDGFVSIQRSLWEAAVCDELIRLGFASPEVLAILSTGRTTVDNTDAAWPAGAAVRASPTHWRVGHLLRWRGDKTAMRSVVAEAGRAIFGTFDLRRPKDVENLALSFARNLGFDVGRTDAMNILCFNPTIGNVRLDGHFIDFSTVRFFRHRANGYALLEGKKLAGGHRHFWRPFCHILPRALEEARLVDGANLASRAFREFDRADVDGYLTGLFSFLGPTGSRSGTPAARRALVSAARAFVDLPASEELPFPFFGKTSRAPLFDLQGRAKELLEAIKNGHPEPWQVTRSPFAGEVDSNARTVGRRLIVALRRVLPVDKLDTLKPQRHEWVIRPTMQVEALRKLCYESTESDVSDYADAMSTSRALAPGRYRYLEARAEAIRLGHVALEGLRPNRYEVAVGLTPGLHRSIRRLLADLLGARLVGVIAHGSRILPRDRLRVADPEWLSRHEIRLRPFEGVRELGCDPSRSSDLDLKIFVRDFDLETRTRLELELGATLLALGATFPLCGHDPPRQRLLPTECEDLESAFQLYNELERVQRYGRPCPISPEQCVVFFDPARQHTDPRPKVLAALSRPTPGKGRELVPIESLDAREDDDTLCVLSRHQLEMCLRDDPSAQPDPPRAELVKGRLTLSKGGACLEAMRAAGRTEMVIRR